MKKVKVAPTLFVVITLGLIVLLALILSEKATIPQKTQDEEFLFVQKEKIIRSVNGKKSIQSKIEYREGSSSGGNAYYSYHIELNPFPTKEMEQEVKAYIAKELNTFSKNASINNDPESEFFIKNDIEIVGTPSYSHTINSYILEIYEYTGGAHGNYNYVVFNYSKENGKKLTLNDILSSPDALNTLHDIAAKQLSAKGIEYDEQGIAPKEENWQLWYADGENIVFIFPPYAVAPYTYGRQDVIISTKEYPTLFKKWVRSKGK